jgi:hypothetical protein
MYLEPSVIEAISLHIQTHYKTDIAGIIISLLNHHRTREESKEIARNGPKFLALIAEHPQTNKAALDSWALERAGQVGSQSIKDLTNLAREDSDRTDATHASMKVAEGWNMNTNFGEKMHMRATGLWNLLRALVSSKESAETQSQSTKTADNRGTGDADNTRDDEYEYEAVPTESVDSRQSLVNVTVVSLTF